MSLNLLKRELEKDLNDFDLKKKKKEETDSKKRKNKTKKTDKSSKFSFNDKDYTKEDDHTEECLRYLGVLDGKVAMNSERIIQRNTKLKRQDKIQNDMEKKKGKEEEGSIFTDADFEIVSKLHFINSKKAVIVDDDET